MYPTLLTAPRRACDEREHEGRGQGSAPTPHASSPSPEGQEGDRCCDQEERKRTRPKPRQETTFAKNKRRLKAAIKRREDDQAKEVLAYAVIRP